MIFCHCGSSATKRAENPGKVIVETAWRQEKSCPLFYSSYICASIEKYHADIKNNFAGHPHECSRKVAYITITTPHRFSLIPRGQGIHPHHTDSFRF